jgi:sugar phosphate permease
MKWEKYHTVWALLIFGWITNYMVRASLSPLLLPILNEFKLTYAEAGILATAFFYAYTFMQLPAATWETGSEKDRSRRSQPGELMSF